MGKDIILFEKMGRVIRGQRKGCQTSVYKSHTFHRVAPCKLRICDYVERQGYVKGVVRDLVHDPGRGAPLAVVQFTNPNKHKKDIEHFVACESMYVGQYIYCGNKAQIATGNILPINKVPEGTTVCNVEHYHNDGGAFARASGSFVTVIGQAEDGTKTRIKLPSGHKKTIKGKMYPKVRGVCMNPVEHPHGGGNHQHVGKPTTISRWKSAGRKVGLIAARRSGRIRGGIKLKFGKDK